MRGGVERATHVIGMNTPDFAAFAAASRQLDDATAGALSDGIPLEEDFAVAEAQTWILNLFDREAESRVADKAA